jgi:antitoxin component of MazEF toxin-antitoxin module
MSRERIHKAGDAAAVRLPPQILEDLGISIGDEVEMSVKEGAIMLRPIDEAERTRRIEDASTAVIDRRKSAYEELARGAD